MLWLTCLTLVLTGDALTAPDIVARATAHNAFGFANAQAEVSLVLHNANGAERKRQVSIRQSDKSGSRRTLVRFVAPADVAGAAYLVIENQHGEDDQYLYLPALGKTKRITGTQRQQKFMGTDLTYADLQGKDLRAATSKRLTDAEVAGAPAFVIEARPTDGADSPYSRTVVWIHQTAFVPLKVEYYDRDDHLVKVLTVPRLEQQGEQWVARETVVRDMQTGSETRMQVTHIDFNKTFAAADFDQRALAGG